jgi:hypothetical protein
MAGKRGGGGGLKPGHETQSIPQEILSSRISSAPLTKYGGLGGGGGIAVGCNLGEYPCFPDLTLHCKAHLSAQRNVIDCILAPLAVNSESYQRHPPPSPAQCTESQ